jgi:hypothetical protein
MQYHPGLIIQCNKSNIFLKNTHTVLKKKPDIKLKPAEEQTSFSEYFFRKIYIPLPRLRVLANITD